MFSFKPPEKSGLEKAIDELLVEMAEPNKESEEYAQMADQLVKLYSLKSIDAPKRISPDTLAVVLGNLIGIALIVGHERTHVVTSKALNFVREFK